MAARFRRALSVRATVCFLALLLAACGMDQPAVTTVAAKSATTAGEPPTIRAEVSYAGRIDTLPADAVLFVFARPVGESMPLAVERLEPSRLPLVVEFARKAQPIGEVEVVARLSLSGDVYLKPGDVETVSAPVAAGASLRTLQLRVADRLALDNGRRSGLPDINWRAEAVALEASR